MSEKRMQAMTTSGLLAILQDAMQRHGDLPLIYMPTADLSEALSVTAVALGTDEYGRPNHVALCSKEIMMQLPTNHPEARPELRVVTDKH